MWNDYVLEWAQGYVVWLGKESACRSRKMWVWDRANGKLKPQNASRTSFLTDWNWTTNWNFTLCTLSQRSWRFHVFKHRDHKTLELDFSKIVKCFDKVLKVLESITLELQKNSKSCCSNAYPNGAQGLKYLST